MRRWLVPFLAGAATIGLVAASALAFVQFRSARQATAAVDQRRSEVADLQSRLDRLERSPGPPADNGSGTDNGLGGLLGGLLGGDAGGAGGLLGGLTGGLGDIPGAQCLVPGGDALGGLLGGGGSSNPLPDDPKALVDVVSAQVADQRELDFARTVDVTFLDEQAMRTRLQQLNDQEYSAEDANIEGAELIALGAVAPGTDLRAVRRQLLGDQVAGFYDPDTGELVVRSPDGKLSPTDQIALAHELEHALADQALDLPDLEAPRFATDGDAQLATLAVVEGDATLLMNQWSLAHVPLTDQLTMAGDPALLASQQSLNQAPPYLASELTFPYTAGLDYTCDAWQDGGWGSVDATYQQIPQTTAGVLWADHPGRTGTPTTLTAPPGYVQRDRTTFGAAQLKWLLEAPGGDTSQALSDPSDRAQAWGGGRLTLWGRGSDTAVGLALTDTSATGTDLCATVTDWYAAAFPASTRQPGQGQTSFDGAAQSAVVACSGANVDLGIGPDVTTATAAATT